MFFFSSCDPNPLHYTSVLEAPDVSNSKAVTVTVGRQENKEENTITAVSIGQIPAAQQLFINTGQTRQKVRILRVT